jgi:hypothetical protein
MPNERPPSSNPPGTAALRWIRDRIVALYHGWWR